MKDKIKKIQDALENWTEFTLSTEQIEALVFAIAMSDQDVQDDFNDLVDTAINMEEDNV